MIILHNLKQIATGPSNLPLNKNIYKLFWYVRSSFKSVTLASLIPLFKIGRQMIDFYLVSLISLQTSNSFSLKLSSFYGMESAHSLYMFHELRTVCFIKNLSWDLLQQHISSLKCFIFQFLWECLLIVWHLFVGQKVFCGVTESNARFWLVIALVILLSTVTHL